MSNPATIGTITLSWLPTIANETLSFQKEDLERCLKEAEIARAKDANNNI